MANNGYSSLRRNFLSEIPAYLLTLVYGGKSLRIFTQRNHSQTRYLQAENRTYEENWNNNFNADFIQLNWTKSG